MELLQLGWYPKVFFWELLEQDFLKAGCPCCCQAAFLLVLLSSLEEYSFDNSVVDKK